MAILTAERNEAESRGHGHVHSYILNIVYAEICFMDRLSKAVP
jgi:hypothetical protein